MTDKTDGGAAFPMHRLDENGMTLRDYFAAKALQAYLTAMAPPRAPSFQEFAEYSYKMADAMLKVRAK